MVKAANLTPKFNKNIFPIINYEPKPCAVCGKLFWHHSFHRNRKSGKYIKQTCGEGCRYILKMRSERKNG